MIKLYSPENEVQLSILKSLLEAQNIPIFVHNDSFGSIYPGLQVELFNARTIMVDERHYEKAQAVLREFLANLDQAAPEQTARPTYSFFDKVRMVFEALIFGWLMPGRKWRKSPKDSEKEGDEQRSDEH